MREAVVLLLAVIFLSAAHSKLRARAAFRSVLDRLLPKPLARLLATTVPLMELGLGLWLISGFLAYASVYVALITLGLFTLTLAIMKRRGIEGCACFGERSPTTPVVGLIRNALLIAFGAWLVSGGSWEPVWQSSVSTVLGETTLVVGALCAWVCAVTIYAEGQRNELLAMLGRR